MSFSEWIHMGGYGLYVWGSFGMTALCMLIEIIMLRSSAKNVRQRIARINRAES